MYIYMVASTGFPFEAILCIINDIIFVKQFNQSVIGDCVKYFTQVAVYQ